MKLRIWILSLVILPAFTQAQLNVEYLSNLDYEPILNDIWGYVDENGTEYALVGMTSGVSIVSLEDPTDPKEVQFIPGVNSTWRDLKTWGDFGYCIADQGQDGLLIMDLSPLPEDTATYTFWKDSIFGIGPLQRSHNIWIDEYGMAYLAGARVGGTPIGTFILDVNTNPWKPIDLAILPLDYSHDVYARDSIVYTSEIYEGQLKLYDIRDLGSIQLLGFVTTPFSFTHNAWPSDDSKTVFTTDERSNAYVAAYDVSDPGDIKELDRYRPAATEGLSVIPHNVHVFNDYLIISYYTDGCIIVDGSRPDNLIEVGNYDTYLEGHGGYSGAWGAYPFLPSGNILISDRQHGLFVLGPTYKRGCYLEGDVKDKGTQQPIGGVTIEIFERPEDGEVIKPIESDPDGSFKTGKAVNGDYLVSFFHPDYYPFEATYTFENGVVTEVHVELERKPEFNVTGRVVEFGSGDPVPYANVALEGPLHSYHVQAGDDGQYVFPSVFEESYKVYAGNWGQFGIYSWDVLDVISQDIEISNGYYDDFNYEYGWTVNSTSQNAVWERAQPNSELLFGQYQCNPDLDVQTDFGPLAFVTGNAGGNAANDGVLDGNTILSSPIMDLLDYKNPMLQFESWLCQRFIDEQSFSVSVSNGTDTVQMLQIESVDIGGEWTLSEIYELNDLIDITSTMQVHFATWESLDLDNVVKTGIDVFTVTDEAISSVLNSIEAVQLSVYPNPANDNFIIDLSEIESDIDIISLVNTLGVTVLSERVSGPVMQVNVSRIPEGMYVMLAHNDGRVVGTGKLIVVGSR